MRIKVISLNLWWGGELMLAILDFLKSEDADVIALQEVYNATDPNLEDHFHSVEVLQSQLGFKYSDFAQAFIHDGPKGKHPFGNAVLSKFPITSSAVHFLVEPTREYYEDVPAQWPLFPRVMQHAELKTPAGSLNVYNIHGVWDLAGDSYSLERQIMFERIVGAIKNIPNVILTGDTNATQANPGFLTLKPYLKEVFDEKLTTTFNIGRKSNPGYATAAVDLMYVSPNIKVISKTVPNVDISDHLPLVVTLDIT